MNLSQNPSRISNISQNPSRISNISQNPSRISNIYPIKELCISGASQRGLSYLGAIKCLEDEQILKRDLLEKIVAVSIGSFVSACYLAKYDMTELLEIIIDTDISLFKDIQFTDISILKGHSYKNWVMDVLSKKLPRTETMSSFYKRTSVDFIIGTVCLEDGLVFISHNNFPDMLLIDALMASMSIPFVFQPYIIDGKTYVDGGLISNLPMQELGPNAIGIKSKRKRHGQIYNTMSYIIKLFETVTDHIKKIDPYKSNNIFDINVSDPNVVNFDIDIDDKITLYKEGFEYVKNSELLKKLIESKDLYEHRQKYLEIVKNINNLLKNPL